jgi:hypothetical protein
MNAFLHFGTGTDPRLTLSVPCKEAPLPWQTRGLTWTATGYGLRIPSRYMVRHNGKWRRVYVCQVSNAGSAFIGKTGAWEATVSLDD